MHPMRRFLSTVPAVMAALTIAAPTPAQAPHSNFSGTWVLDTSATQAGPMTPAAMTYTITEQGDTVRITRAATTPQGELTTTAVYGTDGKPWKNTVTQMGTQVDVTSVLTWEGPTLVITSDLAANGQTIHQVEKWTLDASSNKLTADRAVDAMGQHFTSRWVFNRRTS